MVRNGICSCNTIRYSSQSLPDRTVSSYPLLALLIRLQLVHGSHVGLSIMFQLRHEMAANRAFEGFHEMETIFCPTYKYDPGTQRFDSSEKARSPAWCDRVLWRSTMTEPLDYR